MDDELRLKGHGWIVHRLAAVPTPAGRTLLASGDTEGTVRLWDPTTGEAVARPLTLDETVVRSLAALRLASGTQALVTSAPRGIALWDPARLGDGPPLRHFAAPHALALAVVPATAGRPESLVTADAQQVRVIDPNTGSVLFRCKQPEGRRGHVGAGVHRLTGVRITDRTAGFAAIRYGGAVELWYPRARGRGWAMRQLDPGRRARGAMEYFTGLRDEPRLALGSVRGIEVWDLRTGRLMLDGDFAHGPCTALAAVPLARRTVLAAAFGTDRDAGVQLWDPEAGRELGPVLNRPGPAFGRTSWGGVAVHAVVVLAGSDGAMRVASAGNDGTVRVSPAMSGLTPSKEGRKPSREGR